MLSCIKSDSLIAIGRDEDWPSTLWMYTLGGGVDQIIFSPDNKSIAACSLDGNISIFDVKTGVLEMRLRGHNAAVHSIAFAPDGKRLVSGSADSAVIIWDLQTGDVVGKPLIGHFGKVTSVVYSPDGRFIASRDETIRIWDAQSGTAIRVMQGCQSYGRLAYSPDGAKVAC